MVQNAPSTETPAPVSHPLLGESLFSHSPLSGVIDNWTPQYESKKGGKLCNEIRSTGWKWSSLNAPTTETLVSHPLVGESLFLIFLSLG